MKRVSDEESRGRRCFREVRGQRLALLRPGRGGPNGTTQRQVSLFERVAVLRGQ